MPNLAVKEFGIQRDLDDFGRRRIHKNNCRRLSAGRRQVALVTENERQAAASDLSALGLSSSAAAAALRSPGLAEANSLKSPPK